MECVLCGNDSFQDVCQVDAKTSESLRVSMCNHCGLIQQNPIPTNEELIEYYSHNYRLDYKKTYTPKTKHIYRAGKNALKRLEFMKAAGIVEGKLLDVGAGGGEFVYLSSKMGFKSQGIEPNVGYSEYAATTYCCNIQTGGIDAIQGTYDVITMFHVLEHLLSPKLSFEKLYHSLNADGVLFIEVPWIETNNTSPHNIFFKAHILYFSVDTLIACASQYFDAFKVEASCNLKIFFRAKKTPTDITYPSKLATEKLKQRMREKGWFEYLLKGKGLMKPITKIIGGFEENKVKSYQPKEMLDWLLSESTS